MKKNFLLAGAFLLSSWGSLWAIPAYPGVITKTLPDGTTIEIRLHGDENFNYITLADGETLVKEGADGYYYYATASDNGVTATRYKVGTPMPQKVQSSVRVDDAVLQTLGEKATEKRNATLKKFQVQKAAPSGEIRGIAILVNYTDVKFTHDKQMFVDVLNKPGYNEEYATGSAYDYFVDSSYGQFRPTFDVFGPYDLPHECAYYGGNDYWGNDKGMTDLIVDACRLASEAGVDLSVYDQDKDGRIDQVYVFYAGEGEANGGSEDTIWPHRYMVIPDGKKDGYISGSDATYDGTDEDVTFNGVKVYDYACSNEICKSYAYSIGTDFDGVGTFIHEFGHVLGLPDMYATTYATHTTLEIYDVMDKASYLNYSRTPVSYSAYERMFMGWLHPTQIYPSYEGTELELPILDDGEAFLVTADGSEHNMDGQNPDPATYYLFENKPNTGWDMYANYGAFLQSKAQQGDRGLLITKIRYNSTLWDNNMVNNSSSSMGISYMYNRSKQANYYPMFPGMRNVTELEIPNSTYTVSNVTMDEDTGTVKFTISDSSAQPNQGGVSDAASDVAVAKGGNGEISFVGNAGNVTVANLQGSVVYSGEAQTLQTPAGIYIVSFGNGSVSKVIVR